MFENLPTDRTSYSGGWDPQPNGEHSFIYAEVSGPDQQPTESTSYSASARVSILQLPTVQKQKQGACTFLYICAVGTLFLLFIISSLLFKKQGLRLAFSYYAYYSYYYRSQNYVYGHFHKEVSANKAKNHILSNVGKAKCGRPGGYRLHKKQKATK